MNIVDKEQCCGCRACEQICFQRAITMDRDKEGFIYPIINSSVCIKCGLCEKVCPLNGASYQGQDAEPKVYAGINMKDDVCLRSSSGGIFTALSNYILKHGGNVYGVILDDDFSVKHIGTKEINTRDKMCGSKYVQSEISNTYTQIAENLRNGEIVLFTGTPCQVEGLNKYLSIKNIPCGNLYTVDNICHGVASPLIWEEYIKELQQLLEDGEKIEYLSMRSKSVEWRKQEMLVCTDKKDISEWINSSFSWNRLYRTQYLTRPSCFSCHFTSYKRCADITLADYWNFENAEIDLDDKNGVSLILVNSKKGEKLIEMIQSEVCLKDSNKEKCWQIHLEFPSSKPQKREQFWKELETNGIRDALYKYTKGSFFNKLVRAVTPCLRKLGIYSFVARIYNKISK